MLVSFSLENWTSFRDPVTFSMVASRERQHLARVPRLDKYGASVLPIAAIYGGNASGKSNFLSALAFARWLVVEGAPMDSLIEVAPFQLDAGSARHPSRFRFELLVDETIYEFSFAVTSEAVAEERLVRIDGKQETVLYDRQGETDRGPGFAPEQPALRYAFQGTRSNQLFLTNSVLQKIDDFRPVYDWFKAGLQIITPHTVIGQIRPLIEEGLVRTAMNRALGQLDTGIAGLEGKDVDLEQLGLPQEFVSELKQKLGDSASASLFHSAIGEPLLVTRENGRLAAQKLVAAHRTVEGQEVSFEMRMESDGTRRLIDLLPAFFDLSGQGSKSVFVIDEIDRSLHTLLLRELLSTFLEGCSAESRAQLLLTTHDTQLMDQELFRRDEMWVTERNVGGDTSLFSFSEYQEMRRDKDVRRSYLQGRIGGIPRVLLTDGLAAFAAEENGGRG